MVNPLVSEQNVKQRFEVIVYCSNRLCPASINAYMLLQSRGFNNLYRFAGGLEEWSEAGYPLEGSLVPEMKKKQNRLSIDWLMAPVRKEMQDVQA